jgi:CMP-N-acetylneuraminic acid synthetase
VSDVRITHVSIHGTILLLSIPRLSTRPPLPLPNNNTIFQSIAFVISSELNNCLAIVFFRTHTYSQYSYRNSQNMSCHTSYIRHCNQTYQKRKVNYQTNLRITFDNKEAVIKYNSCNIEYFLLLLT